MRQYMRVVVIIALLALFAVPALAQQGSIGVGDTVTGNLTASQPSATYTLNADAGQAVNIHLVSNDFDAYLTLKDANGNTLAENDDADSTNSLIQGFVLPAGTTYTILVESYDHHEGSGGESGAYTLSVSEQQLNHIEYSQSVNGQLTSDQFSADYVFSGQSGDVIVATETSGDFDSELYLLDSNGNQLTYNDDSGGTLNSMIGPYTLPSTGSYTLRVSSIDGSSTGAYTVTLNKAEVNNVSYDTPTEVNFTTSDSGKYFTFEGTSGDLVTISADSGGSIDTSLTLSDPNGYQVASDDDGGSGFDPEIYQQLLSSTGTYTVALTAAAPGSGKVTLTVKHTLPPSLDEGPQSMAFSSSVNSHAVMFTATAGENVRLTLHLTSGQSGAPSVTVMQGDTTLASGSGSQVTDLTLGFTPSSDGQVVVQITDYSYSSVSYEVTLAHSSE